MRNTTPSSIPSTDPLDTATNQLLDHIGDVEADGIFNFSILNSITDDDGVFWFHLRGHSNSDDEIHRDDNLYEVRPSGVIRSYSPRPNPRGSGRGEYWNIDWGHNPLDQLYFRHGRRWLLGSYFDKPEVEARFNKETGELTSRYHEQFYPSYKRVAVRALYARFDNPFRCTIAGNPEQYERDEISSGVEKLATPELKREYAAATDKYLVAVYAVDALDLRHAEDRDRAIELLEDILES